MCKNNRIPKEFLLQVKFLSPATPQILPCCSKLNLLLTPLWRDQTCLVALSLGALVNLLASQTKSAFETFYAKRRFWIISLVCAPIWSSTPKTKKESQQSGALSRVWHRGLGDKTGEVSWRWSTQEFYCPGTQGKKTTKKCLCTFKCGNGWKRSDSLHRSCVSQEIKDHHGDL